MDKETFKKVAKISEDMKSLEAINRKIQMPIPELPKGGEK